MDGCGLSGCVQLGLDQSQQIWSNAGQVGRPLRAPSPFYVLRYRWYASGPEQPSYYVPAGRALRVADEGDERSATWIWLGRPALSVIDRAVAGPAPYPVTPPKTVTVAEKPARWPETYLRLLSGRGGGWMTPATIWITVTMRSDPPTPWTDGLADFRISAPGRSRLVMLDGWVHTVLLRIANRARRGLPLSP